MKLTKDQLKIIPLYTYRIEWSQEDHVFVVSIDELPGCMTHGKTQLEALKMGHEAVQCHVEAMAKDKIEIPQPFALQKFKGEFLVRGSPELHRKIAIESKRKGYSSINKFVVEALKKVVG